MKIKYLLSGLLASILVTTSCQDPDDLIRTNSENVTVLTIKGRLISDEAKDYAAVIDEANKTITIQVPYYISDTKEIQGDLTQMRVLATLPVGAKFEPSISGIHDLTEGFQSTLVNEDGTKIPYTFKATYVKSKLSSISKVELTDYSRATIRVIEPETEGAKGKVIIYKTSSAIDGALKSAALAISPWATIESSAMDPQTGIIDLSGQPDITIVAQNGIEKTIYQTSLELPELLPRGVGYIASLFAFQTYTDDTHGFEVSANRTIAIVDDYLIISNSADYTKMIVMDRYNGKTLDIKVNTEGIDADRSIHAITNDDAGHLVVMTYTHSINGNQNVRAWAWKNGITSKPTSIVYASLQGGYFANLRSVNSGTTAFDIARTIRVKGNIFSGNAILGTICLQKYRPVFMRFKDGNLDGNVFVEWQGGVVSMWNSSQAIPLSTDAYPSYIWGTANYQQGIHYVPSGEGTNKAVQFGIPSSHWWTGSGTYDKNIKGISYIDFNGTSLIGIQNGLSSNGVWAHRLYVSDISNAPGASSLSNGFIFDSREGNNLGTDGIPGTGYGVAGMTSAASYVSGKQVLGANSNETGDVIFGRSADGNAVQVYMLTTDQGVLAYDITKFKM